MSKLAALYARVSTLQQEQEATIDSQVAAIESYAQGQGYRLSKELFFLDQAVSGAYLDRPALNRLRDLVAEGLFEVVLCFSPDRLARQYAHQWVIMNKKCLRGRSPHGSAPGRQGDAGCTAGRC